MQSHIKVKKTFEYLNNSMMRIRPRASHNKRQRMLILVVDDTPSNLFVMKMIFEEIKELEIELKPALNG